MSTVVLDTDVVSQSIRRRLPTALETRLTGFTTSITFVTYAELTQWAVVRDWGQRNRQALMHRLSYTPVIHSNPTIARVWGEISGRAKQRGRTSPQNDTWIAACCLSYELPLATLNVKDFQYFVDHEGLTLITA